MRPTPFTWSATSAGSTFGQILIAIISSIASHGSVSAGTVLLHVVGTVLFLALNLTLGSRLVGESIRQSHPTR